MTREIWNNFQSLFKWQGQKFGMASSCYVLKLSSSYLFVLLKINNGLALSA